MRTDLLPSFKYLGECFQVRRGVLIWRTRPAHHFSSAAVCSAVNTQRAGKAAGVVGKDGYILVRVKGRLITAHGIVWALAKGAWPVAELDHRDLNRANNRLSNLREAVRTQNMANRPAHKDNLLGVKGVTRLGESRYRARLYAYGVAKHLGVFASVAAAQAAYLAAARQAKGVFAR